MRVLPFSFNKIIIIHQKKNCHKTEYLLACPGPPPYPPLGSCMYKFTTKSMAKQRKER